MLAFPANNFGAQEPGTNLQIKSFCAGKGVSFPLFAKISVKGGDQHPLYKYLTDKKRGAKIGGDVKWNFQKYVVGVDGKPIARFEPKEDPLSPKVIQVIETALKRVPNSVKKSKKGKAD